MGGKQAGQRNSEAGEWLSVSKPINKRVEVNRLYSSFQSDAIFAV
jgi:hypothetical protein